MNSTNEESKVWVTTQPTIEGGDFALEVHYHQDHVFALSRAEGIEYAMAWIEAISRADYQAAIMAQMTQVVGDEDDAAQAVLDFRNQSGHGEIEAPGSGFTLTPGVAKDDDNQPVGFVECIALHDAWTWRGDAVRDHASHVLEGVCVAPLDAAYLRTLVHSIDIDEGRARQVIEDLGNYRKDNDRAND